MLLLLLLLLIVDNVVVLVFVAALDRGLMFLPDWVPAATKNLIRISCFLASALTAGVKCTPNIAAFQALTVSSRKKSRCSQRCPNVIKLEFVCIACQHAPVWSGMCTAALVGCRVKLDPSDMRKVKLPVVDYPIMQSFFRCTNQTQVTNKMSNTNNMIDKQKQKT